MLWWWMLGLGFLGLVDVRFADSVLCVIDCACWETDCVGKGVVEEGKGWSGLGHL